MSFVRKMNFAFRNFSFRNSVFKRITITFVIILLPIFAVGFNLYNLGAALINENIGSFTQKQNDSYLGNLENEMRRITVLQWDLFSDKNLLFLMLPSSLTDYYNRDQSLLRLQDRLNTIKSSSRFIEDVKVYLPSSRLMITPTTNKDDVPASDLIAMLPEFRARPINYWGGRLMLIAAYPAESASFIIEIDLSAAEIRKMLRELNIYPGSGAFLYSPDLDYFVDDGTNTAISEKIMQSVQTSSNEPATEKSSGESGKFIPVWAGKTKYLEVLSFSKYLGFSLVRYSPDSLIFSKVYQYRVWFWVFAFLSACIILIFSFSIYRLIHRPLNKLVNAFGSVKTGNLDVRIQHGHKDEFKFIYENFNDMVSNLGTLIEQSYKNKILTQKAELKQLQSQINPHFLYNSFFILQKRIKYADNANALVFAEQLGNFFQFITRNARDEVPLCKEVEHARIYTDIQQMRFSKRLKVSFGELPEEWKNVDVPRIILQPVIENAFEHSLEMLPENGRLAVVFETAPNTLFIHIENNGSRLETSELQALKDKLYGSGESLETTGLINTHRRLQLKFGAESGILLSPGSEGGLKVTMTIKRGEDANGV